MIIITQRKRLLKPIVIPVIESLKWTNLVLVGDLSRSISLSESGSTLGRGSAGRVLWTAATAVVVISAVVDATGAVVDATGAVVDAVETKGNVGVEQLEVLEESRCSTVVLLTEPANDDCCCWWEGTRFITADEDNLCSILWGERESGGSKSITLSEDGIGDDTLASLLLWPTFLSSAAKLRLCNFLVLFSAPT